MLFFPTEYACSVLFLPTEYACSVLFFCPSLFIGDSYGGACRLALQRFMTVFSDDHDDHLAGLLFGTYLFPGAQQVFPGWLLCAGERWGVELPCGCDGISSSLPAFPLHDSKLPPGFFFWVAHTYVVGNCDQNFAGVSGRTPDSLLPQTPTPPSHGRSSP